MYSFSDVLRAFLKLFLGTVWLMIAMLTWLWSYGIVKSIGRLRTQTNAGEFLTPNNADVYPLFLFISLILLTLVSLAFRRVQWSWPKEE
jgi:hypothetical protein